MKIKSFLTDILGSSRVTKKRKEAIKKASDKLDYKDPVSEVAKALHPGKFLVRIKEIKNASLDSKTITFEGVNGHIPLFKAGQYMTLEMKIGDSILTRPYSISSAPYQTRGENPIVEITVRKVAKGGFSSLYLYDEAKVGDIFMAEVGLGQFYYEPLRDSQNVVCLAGGSSITPFISMAKEVKDGKLDINLTILYGSVSEDNIILKDEIEACVCDKVKVIHVLSGDNPTWNGEKGLLSSEIINKYAPDNASFFICGPNPMIEYAKKELAKLNVHSRRIRVADCGQPSDISACESYPKEKKNETFSIHVFRGILETIIESKAVESIAVALERAGIFIHTACRSGACGFCRIKVLEGSYFVSPYSDGRRKTDKEFNYVHACSTYPLSDMWIKIPI